MGRYDADPLFRLLSRRRRRRRFPPWRSVSAPLSGFGAVGRQDGRGGVANASRSNPDLIERIRTQLLVHADTVAPLEAIVAKAMTAAMAGLEPTTTLVMGRRYRVSWADGSTAVTGDDGRRYKVSWPADGIGVDLDEA